MMALILSPVGRWLAGILAICAAIAGVWFWGYDHAHTADKAASAVDEVKQQQAADNAGARYDGDGAIVRLRAGDF